MENNTTLSPLDIKPEQRVRVHYHSSTAREGVVKQHDYYVMVVEQESGHIAALFTAPDYAAINGWGPYISKVELLEDAPADPRVVELEAEVERLNGVVRQRNADVSSSLAREGAAREREQDITEALDDLKRKVGAELVGLADAHGWDMDTVEEAIDYLDLELPKPKPFEFTLSLDVDFTAHPATRKIAKQIDSSTATTEQITAVLEKALTGLDGIDLDESVLSLDPYRGMNVQIRDFDIN